MAAGDKTLWADVANAINKPICQLAQQATQSLTSGTNAAITFGAGSELIDTHNFHDTVTNNTRITPTIAGYYRVTGTLWLAGATTTTIIIAIITRNGVNYMANRIRPDAANGAAPSVQVSAVMFLNGTTDFVELLGGQTDSGAAARSTVLGAGTSPALELVYERPT